MKEEINQAAHRCENLGSIENLDEVDLPENLAIAPLAESVNQGLQQAMTEVSWCVICCCTPRRELFNCLKLICLICLYTASQDLCI